MAEFNSKFPFIDSLQKVRLVQFKIVVQYFFILQKKKKVRKFKKKFLEKLSSKICLCRNIIHIFEKNS